MLRQSDFTKEKLLKIYFIIIECIDTLKSVFIVPLFDLLSFAFLKVVILVYFLLQLQFYLQFKNIIIFVDF